MKIEIKEVNNRKSLKKFIYFPSSIYKENSNWIPPIYMDEWKFFNPNKNKSFKYCDTCLVLAYENNEIAGRIMGIINKRYNENNNEKNARFSFLECNNNQEVANALLTYIENWAREKKMETIVGPLGFSDKDPQGCLIEGFENRCVISAPYNLEYLPQLIENAGFKKKNNLVSYQIKVPDEIPDLYKKVHDRVFNNPNYEIFEPKTKKQLKQNIIPVFNLLNETYASIYAFDPLDDEEKKEFANRYISILNPDFTKTIKKDETMAAFIISMPDISEGVQKAKGKIFPLGLFKILRSQKKTKQLVLLLGAVKEKYRGLGLDFALAYKILETAKKYNFETIDSHLILENNTKMRAEAEKFGGKVYKRFRIFQKDL